MGSALHGVTCFEGDVALFFTETADLVGVNVTLKEGDRAVTARLTPEAWGELCDRYGGPLAGIKCKNEPDDCSPESVAAMKERIEELESTQRYITDERRKLADARDAANKLAEERAPSFQVVEDLRRERDAQKAAREQERELCAVQSEEIVKLTTRVKELEAMLQPTGTTGNGRRAMMMDDEPQTMPFGRGQ